MKNKYVALRVKNKTHKRIKMLSVEADMKIDDFVNELANEYERSRAISRGFARKPLPHPEVNVSP